MGIISFPLCVGVPQLVSGFLSGNFSWCSRTFNASTGGEKFRSLLRCHLGLFQVCLLLMGTLYSILRMYHNFFDSLSVDEPLQYFAITDDAASHFSHETIYLGRNVRNGIAASLVVFFLIIPN